MKSKFALKLKTLYSMTFNRKIIGRSIACYTDAILKWHSTIVSFKVFKYLLNVELVDFSQSYLKLMLYKVFNYFIPGTALRI